jgi:hypothetical protein
MVECRCTGHIVGLRSHVISTICRRSVSPGGQKSSPEGNLIKSAWRPGVEKRNPYHYKVRGRAKAFSAEHADTHLCNPSTGEVGGYQVPGQPGLRHSNTLPKKQK